MRYCTVLLPFSFNVVVVPSNVYRKHMTAELALEAVKNTKRIILHTDLGNQYTVIYLKIISEKGIKHYFNSKDNH